MYSILDDICISCLTNKRDVLYLPCSHLVVCRICNALAVKAKFYKCMHCYGTVERRFIVNNLCE